LHVEAYVYDALAALPEPASFDLAFVSWGAIMWLPDIRRWAEIAAGFLKPGGELYLADAHPAALVFDDAAPGMDNLPGYYAPYFSREPILEDDDRDYADDVGRLRNTCAYAWIHPLSDIITRLLEAGLTLSWLHEHACVPWRMFETLVKGHEGMYRWPDKPWLPLAFSLKARRQHGPG
jgi:SAM-dependent methyltransferase